MAGKRSTPEQLVARLRQVEVLTGQGKSVAEAVRAIGVTEPTYYRWRTEFGGLKLDQVKRLKELERENARLRKTVFRPDAREGHLEGSCIGKVLSPVRRRACVEHVVRELGVSERKACAVLGQHRSTLRKRLRADSWPRSAWLTECRPFASSLARAVSCLTESLVTLAVALG
jgi:putative transposase